MQQFTVPQFIDVEDKIIGPVTVRQFIIMLVAGFFIFLEYKLSDFALFILLGLPTVLIFAIVAFLKINGMPFHYFLLNFIQTIKRSKLRVWRRIYEKTDTGTASQPSSKQLFSFFKIIPAKQSEAVVQERKILGSRSRLSELSLVVDTGGIYDHLSAFNEQSGFKQ